MSLKEQFKKQWLLLDNWDDIADWWLSKIEEIIEAMGNLDYLISFAAGYTSKKKMKIFQQQLKDKYLKN